MDSPMLSILFLGTQHSPPNPLSRRRVGPGRGKREVRIAPCDEPCLRGWRATVMANIVVVGAQWGDEAKGKIVDYLAQNAAMVVRYGGGNNAGHSVTVGTRSLQIPPRFPPVSSIRRSICVIADGVVIDPGVLVTEIERPARARRSASTTSRSPPPPMSFCPTIGCWTNSRRAARARTRSARPGAASARPMSTRRRGSASAWASSSIPTRFAARLRTVLAEKNVLLTQSLRTSSLWMPTRFWRSTAPMRSGCAPMCTDTAALV